MSVDIIETEDIPEDSKYTFEEYQNCELLDVHRWSEYPEVLAVRKEILAELGFKGTKKEINHVTVVLLNLYHAYCLDPEKWVMYSRDRNEYDEGTRYNKLFIKYDNMIKTVDGLLKLEYIEHVKGFHDRRPGGKSFAPRMKATSKLIDLVEKKHSVTFEMIDKYVPDELIVLRDADKVDIDYVDTKIIISMRSLLERYNKLLSETYIDLHFEVADIQDRIDRCNKKINKKTGKPREYRLSINLSNKTVKRIFNKSTFNKGGRFYGGWWQNIPSNLRKKIFLNTNYTVEIDYSGLHIYLLYALKGINFADLEKEPYIYPKDNDPDDLRPILKTMLLAAVNSSSPEECIKAVRYEINMDMESYPEDIPDLKKLYEDFKEWHPDIVDFFNAKKGLDLQNIDSKIANNVVNIFTEKQIPLLVMHDSFICSIEEEQYLQEVMKNQFYLHAKELGVQDKLLDKYTSTPILMKATDINSKVPDLQKETDIIIDHVSWLGEPQARRFATYLLTGDPTLNVTMKVVNNKIFEVGFNIEEPIIPKDD